MAGVCGPLLIQNLRGFENSVGNQQKSYNPHKYTGSRCVYSFQSRGYFLIIIRRKEAVWNFLFQLFRSWHKSLCFIAHAITFCTLNGGANDAFKIKLFVNLSLYFPLFVDLIIHKIHLYSNITPVWSSLPGFLTSNRLNNAAEPGKRMSRTFVTTVYPLNIPANFWCHGAETKTETPLCFDYSWVYLMTLYKCNFCSKSVLLLPFNATYHCKHDKSTAKQVLFSKMFRISWEKKEFL